MCLDELCDVTRTKTIHWSEEWIDAGWAETCHSCKPSTGLRDPTSVRYKGCRERAEAWCPWGNRRYASRNKRDSNRPRFSEMLVCDFTSWGSDLKSKLCGCWMCFRRFPRRIAVRNALCRRKGRKKNSSLRYTVQRWAASLLTSPPRYFTTSKCKTKTVLYLISSCETNDVLILYSDHSFLLASFFVMWIFQL